MTKQLRPSAGPTLLVCAKGEVYRVSRARCCEAKAKIRFGNGPDDHRLAGKLSTGLTPSNVRRWTWDDGKWAYSTLVRTLLPTPLTQPLDQNLVASCIRVSKEEADAGHVKMKQLLEPCLRCCWTGHEKPGCMSSGVPKDHLPGPTRFDVCAKGSQQHKVAGELAVQCTL